MLDRNYQRRLKADLKRWEHDGVVTPAVGAAIRGALPPLTQGIRIPVIVGIMGGLLIAGAFLAFVAAHWTDIPRIARFGIIATGVVGANVIGAWFARAGRAIEADLCASVGAVIFGAGIALVGQMYHLGEDFAGGMLLWAVGALAAAALTGSRGALAVALVAACVWSGSRSYQCNDAPHFPFLVLWFATASLAFAWNSRWAVHVVVLALQPWWLAVALQQLSINLSPTFSLIAGATLMLGGGLALTAVGRPRLRVVGEVLSVYGAFLLAGAVVLQTCTALRLMPVAANYPMWAIYGVAAGAILAVAAAALTRRAATALAVAAILLTIAAGLLTLPHTGGPWLILAAELCAMLCLVVSGMMDASRSRIVAGWIGIAGIIGFITWAANGALLQRSFFLLTTGAISVAIAALLHRRLPRTEE